ncbi:hypothetical protein KDAU_60250 [Dictyobacter aurantiacus]|uniref:Uncharacterized protein n=1 Tax=Dictyobacter aurantiacus TaxID=1936993 RepID=A0A401ZPL2_9CHLR|nr:hypothetical protein KDAU_60250 [Dictyobacter aurantiacus]
MPLTIIKWLQKRRITSSDIATQASLLIDHRLQKAINIIMPCHALIAQLPLILGDIEVGPGTQKQAAYQESDRYEEPPAQMHNQTTLLSMRPFLRL